MEASAVLSTLFDTQGFPPRWQCGSGWSVLHGYAHIISDLLIFGAYTAIPVALLYFLWKRGGDVPFPRVGYLFAGFILACGTTHALDALMFYFPAYRLLAAMKVLTAGISWLTVLMLVRLLPEALNVPGRARLAAGLQRQVAERRVSEAAVREAAEFSRAVLDSLPEAIAVLDPGVQF